MIDKEKILQTAQALVRQYNLPLKIRGVGPASPDARLDSSKRASLGGEGTEEVTIYFTADKKVGLRELAQELEFQLNLPIKLERIKKSETGKIGGVDVLGKYPCCAPFLRKCPFGGKYGCGYQFTRTQEHKNIKTKEQKTADVKPQKPPKPPKQEKKKKKKMVRQLVIKG